MEKKQFSITIQTFFMGDEEALLTFSHKSESIFTAIDEVEKELSEGDTIVEIAETYEE